jgi:hypothetical protein
VTRAEFAEAAFTFMAVMGASQTSGFRTARHNKKVGGVERSAHLVGLAADVVYDGGAFPAPGVAGAWASKLGLVLVRELDKGHDHLQPADWRKG